MLLSKASEYAIRLVFYLMDKKPDNKWVRIKTAARDLDLPYFQLAKIANTLIKENVLTSFTGPSGGVALKADPSELKLIQIIEPIEGKNVLQQCVLGLEKCGEENPCPIHQHWVETKRQILDLFDNRTLDQLRDTLPFEPTKLM